MCDALGTILVDSLSKKDLASTPNEIVSITENHNTFYVHTIAPVFSATHEFVVKKRSFRKLYIFEFDPFYLEDYFLQ